MKEAFDFESFLSKRKLLIISAAVAPLPNRADKAYTPYKLSKYLDFVSIMAYDIHGSWESEIGQNAPLISSKSDKYWKNWCLRGAVQYWIEKQHFPKERIVLGLANYGRSFQLKQAHSNISIGPGKAGPFTREPGIYSYFEIAELLSKGNLTKRTFDSIQMVPFIEMGDQWIGYDDLLSISLKVEYAKCVGLGGVMFWTIDMDDFLGKFSEMPYPMIKRASRLLSNLPNEDLCSFFKSIQ